MKLVTPQLNDSWKKQIAYLYHLGMRIVIWSAVLWIVLWMYDAVGNNRYASRIYIDRQSQYDVIAFGDSLVEGLGSKDLIGFVGRLERQLGITIYNAGHRRDTTADLLRRVETDVIAFQPKVVIVVIGGNDAVRMIPEAEVLAHVEQLFAQLRAANISIVFGEVTDDVLYKNRNQKLRALAENYGVYYVPGLMEKVFWTISNKFDPLHPDDRGYEKMAERMMPMVEQALRDRGIIVE